MSVCDPSPPGQTAVVEVTVSGQVASAVEVEAPDDVVDVDSDADVADGD